MSKSSKERFYQPDIDGWKFLKKKKDDTNNEENVEEIDKEESDVLTPVPSDKQQVTVKKHFEFFNWTLSFTKNVVQACFILFLIVNLFIAIMITYVYLTTKQVVALEIYISEVYNMFITVIGGYIIKSTTENTIKIVFSVLSDWLEKKYGIEGRLKEPEEESDTYIFTGNRPTPQTGVLADGGTGEGFFGSDESGEDSSDEGEVATDIQEGDDPDDEE